MDTKTAEGDVGERTQEKRLSFNDILAHYRIHKAEDTFLMGACKKTIAGVAAVKVYVMPKYHLIWASEKRNDMQADGNKNGQPRSVKNQNQKILEL